MPAFKGREPRTSGPEDRNGRKDDNVYRLYPKHRREEPVPIGSAEESQVDATTDAGVWSEGGTRRIVDPDATEGRNPDRRTGQPDLSDASAIRAPVTVDPTRKRRVLRPALRIPLAAAAGALVAGAGLALASSSLFAGPMPALHASAGTPAHHVSTAGRGQAARISLPPRSAASSLRSSRPGRRAQAARRHRVRHTSVEQVVYRPTRSSNSTSGVSQATSAPQQAPTSEASSSSQPTTSNTTNQSASAASEAPHPGPNGALVCISNCG
jgi:hypothetical protein